jgi:hypothetical protein
MTTTPATTPATSRPVQDANHPASCGVWSGSWMSWNNCTCAARTEPATTTAREIIFSWNGQPRRFPAGTAVAVERNRTNGTIDIRVRGTLYTQNVYRNAIAS